jgi:hypothetical protein
VLLHRGRLDGQPRGDALVRQPFGHQRQHLALTRRERLERIGAPAAAEHPRDDLGVERRAALGDGAHRVDEVAEIGDPVLEEIADAVCVVADELRDEALHEVLGEHEHAHRGQRAPDLDRRAEPVVGQVGRHPHIDDGHVGLVRTNLAQQVGRVPGPRDDLDPRFFEHSGDALTEQELVVGDHGTQRHRGPEYVGWSAVLIFATRDLALRRCLHAPP